jgi:hypothetical protein
MWKEAGSVEERLEMLKEARDFEDRLEGLNTDWRVVGSWRGWTEARWDKGVEERLDRWGELKGMKIF